MSHLISQFSTISHLLNRKYVEPNFKIVKESTNDRVLLPRVTMIVQGIELTWTWFDFLLGIDNLIEENQFADKIKNLNVLFRIQQCFCFNNSLLSYLELEELIEQLTALVNEHCPPDDLELVQNSLIYYGYLSFEAHIISQLIIRELDYKNRGLVAEKIGLNAKIINTGIEIDRRELVIMDAFSMRQWYFNTNFTRCTGITLYENAELKSWQDRRNLLQTIKKHQDTNFAGEIFDHVPNKTLYNHYHGWPNYLEINQSMYDKHSDLFIRWCNEDNRDLMKEIKK
jgi:hypothetical protein